VSKPALWAPVAARLLLSYGLGVPAAAYAAMLAQLARGAPRHLPPHFMPDEHDADSALWLLRLAHALALAWPLHLSGQGAGSAGLQPPPAGREQELPTPAAVEEMWQVGWPGQQPDTHTHSVSASTPQTPPPCRRPTTCRLCGRPRWAMPRRRTCSPRRSPLPCPCWPPWRAAAWYSCPPASTGCGACRCWSRCLAVLPWTWSLRRRRRGGTQRWTAARGNQPCCSGCGRRRPRRTRAALRPPLLLCSGCRAPGSWTAAAAGQAAAAGWRAVPRRRRRRRRA
jgi:hypothetical protein